MTTTDDTTVTAIVVGYNHAHCLGRCFDALMGQRDLRSLDVVYVDNASSDSSIATTSRHPRIKVLCNDNNLGFARAVNLGLTHARSRYVALVNPDTAVGPSTLRRLIDVLQKHRAVGLVAPRLLGEDGREQQSLTHYPTVSGLVRRLLRRPPTCETGWIVGALVVAEASLWRRLDGLDELYFAYGEDMDLSHRVQRLGLTIHLDTTLHITHTGNPRWSVDRLTRVYGAYLRFLARHHPLQRLTLGPPISALWLGRALASGVDLHRVRAGLLRLWSAETDLPPEAIR